MAIPPLNANGLLPAGIHDASLDEVLGRFGQFQGTDWRVTLGTRLRAFAGEARASGLVASLIVDGSFVSSKEKRDPTLGCPSSTQNSCDGVPFHEFWLRRKRERAGPKARPLLRTSVRTPYD